VPSELKGMNQPSIQFSKTHPTPYRGSFWTVYRGALTIKLTSNPGISIEHEVAIKFLRPEFDADSRLADRKAFEKKFYEALKAWYPLNHTNILPLVGISMTAPEISEFPGLVTTWMSNGRLDLYLKTGNRNVPLELCKGVAEGLNFLHARKIVHGNIQASSIFVNVNGEPRIGDIGILPVLEKTPLMRGGDGKSFAYRWMAPELLRTTPPPAAESLTTDIFAFTMTCLEIYSGDVPFAGEREFAAANAILQNRRPARPPSKKVQDQVWALWQEGWDEDAAKRPLMSDYLKRLSKVT